MLTPDSHGRLKYPGGRPLESSFRGADLSVAQWVFDHGQRAGLGTDTLPAAPAVYLPLGGTQRSLGVLAVLPTNRRRILLPEQRHLLETFAGQIALAWERAALGEEAAASRVAAESESLRNTLLASISHDLRTPLAVIAGAASTLVRHGAALDPADRQSLAHSIEEQAHEMSNLISNVLDLMRLESGRVELRCDTHSVEDLVGAALHRLEPRLQGNPISIDLPEDLPTVNVDPVLVSQVLANLLDNAAKYTPAGTRIRIAAVADAPMVRVVVEDEGPGLPPGDPRLLFEKFQRGRQESAVVGAGLGLAICRAIVSAHGGEITAGPGMRGGARFEFTLPVAEGQRHDAGDAPDPRHRRRTRHPHGPASAARGGTLPGHRGGRRRAWRDRGAHAQARPAAGRSRAAGRRRPGRDPPRPRSGRPCPSSCCRRARWNPRRSRRWMRVPTTTSPSHSALAELLARVRAGLRRSSRGADALPALSLGRAQVDLIRRAATGPAGTIHLTPLEYRVLECLARQDGMIVTSRQLLREVWGPDRVGDSGALRVCIKGLRDKLEPDPRRPRFLVTEAGIGYRLRPGDPDEA